MFVALLQTPNNNCFQVKNNFRAFRNRSTGFLSFLKSRSKIRHQHPKSERSTQKRRSRITICCGTDSIKKSPRRARARPQLMSVPCGSLLLNAIMTTIGRVDSHCIRPDESNTIRRCSYLTMPSTRVGQNRISATRVFRFPVSRTHHNNDIIIYYPPACGRAKSAYRYYCNNNTVAKQPHSRHVWESIIL